MPSHLLQPVFRQNLFIVINSVIRRECWSPSYRIYFGNISFKREYISLSFKQRHFLVCRTNCTLIFIKRGQHAPSIQYHQFTNPSAVCPKIGLTNVMAYIGFLLVYKLKQPTWGLRSGARVGHPIHGSFFWYIEKIACKGKSWTVWLYQTINTMVLGNPPNNCPLILFNTRITLEINLWCVD